MVTIVIKNVSGPYSGSADELLQTVEVQGLTKEKELLADFSDEAPSYRWYSDWEPANLAIVFWKDCCCRSQKIECRIDGSKAYHPDHVKKFVKMLYKAVEREERVKGEHLLAKSAWVGKTEEIEIPSNDGIVLKRGLYRGEKRYEVVSFGGIPDVGDCPAEYVQYYMGMEWGEPCEESAVFRRGDFLVFSGPMEIGGEGGPYCIEVNVGTFISEKEKITLLKILEEAGERLSEIEEEIERLNRDWVGKKEILKFREKAS